MKYFLYFLIFFCHNVYSQTGEINGVVINGEDNTKLASASIFINNTSKGTISNAKGKFTLSGITEKNFDLVISYTGFVTVSVKMTPEKMGEFLTVTMFPRKQNLETVSIMIPEKDGWKKWGNFFTETFLGISDFAKQCTIENPKAILFFNDKLHNQLTAYSDDNLIITNKALGYIIKYQLEDFNYDFKNKITTFMGYASFMEMKGNNRKKERWLKARRDAYLGSIMHFMRSLYTDSVQEQGFDVREKIRIDNKDTLFKKIYVPGNMPTVRNGSDSYKVVPGETNSFKKKPDYVDLINMKPLTLEDHVSFDSSTMQMKFYFDNFIQVVYKKGMVKMDYLLANGLPKYLKMNQVSDANLLSDSPLLIEKDGSYFNPVNIITSGYWGWYKIAEMLPSDYGQEN